MVNGGGKTQCAGPPRRSYIFTRKEAVKLSLKGKLLQGNGRGEENNYVTNSELLDYFNPHCSPQSKWFMEFDVCTLFFLLHSQRGLFPFESCPQCPAQWLDEQIVDVKYVHMHTCLLSVRVCVCCICGYIDIYLYIYILGVRWWIRGDSLFCCYYLCDDLKFLKIKS